jgi:type I restriction enzyme S subunit
VSSLPGGWVWASLEDLAAHESGSITDGPFGSNLKTSDYVDAGVRVVRLGNLGVGQFIDDDRSFITREKFEQLRKHEVLGNDLVVAALAEPVGRCVEVPETLGSALVKADCVRIRVHPDVNRRYLMYCLNSPGGQHRAEAAAHGIGRLRMNLGDIRALSVPLAPRREQRRIVAKIEALFARSRRAKEALTEIVDLEAKLVASYTERFPSTPLGNHIEEVDVVAGERWRTFHAVGLSNGGIITKRKEAIAAKSAPRCRVVHPGDIVFNPIRFSIGAIARYYGTEPAIVSPEYCVFRTKPTFSGELLCRFLRTPLGRSRLEIESQGSVRYRVYLSNLAQLDVPTAPPDRQAEAERFFTVINNVRAVADEAIGDLKKLEASILAKAFRGKLVPQDPNDEPASALLERLRAAKTVAGVRASSPAGARMAVRPKARATHS